MDANIAKESKRQTHMGEMLAVVVPLPLQSVMGRTHPLDQKLLLDKNFAFILLNSFTNS